MENERADEKMRVEREEQSVEKRKTHASENRGNKEIANRQVVKHTRVKDFMLPLDEQKR